MAAGGRGTKGPQRLTLSEPGSAPTIGIPLARPLPPGGLFFGAPASTLYTATAALIGG
jgi:hypothetical protein